ncbi:MULTISPECIES: wax ester/triacylglycerol synthase family O-acyltransferase [unclassified Mycobacterium]|uniref:wax ester/triacylglycerol synthase family O-acyltransferase n=1 Tax=unclassified Mycobacterium TaxID=2642494 RepID=UPI0029C63442|nr:MULTISPECIES: wax ester/triacylglycerol synthase family O-acyltransferase [unclassified Mycobacterium]
MPTKLRPADYLHLRGETNPRTRSGGMGVNLLDTTPDWDTFRAHFDNASRRVLRLRQKVVVPTLRTAAPRWVVDPDFDLNFHVRRVRVPEPATMREVFDMAEVMLLSPMDLARPLWTVTLVEGLPEGRAAMLLHTSHALTDGVGAVEMFDQIFDLERDPPAEPPPPPPVPQPLSPNGLIRQGIQQVPRAIVSAVWGALSMIRSVVLRPMSAAARVVGYSRSGIRVLTPPAEQSPLLRQRSLATRTEALDIRVSDLRKAAKAGGGSFNDAFLAAVCGAVGRYHEALGVPIDTLPMGVPVNLRTEADPAGGNRLTAVCLAAPVGMADPVARMRAIRAEMARRREEPARDIVGSILPILALLPQPLLEAITGGKGPWDLSASNVPSYRDGTYIAGAEVLRQYGLSSLPGMAMAVLLQSLGPWCTVSVRYDRAAIQDDELFAQCLRESFDQILALAGEPAPRVALASSARDLAG